MAVHLPFLVVQPVLQPRLENVVVTVPFHAAAAAAATAAAGVAAHTGTCVAVSLPFCLGLPLLAGWVFFCAPTLQRGFVSSLQGPPAALVGGNQ